MVKVGILSMQRIFNYGSFLQAYALKSIIEELGAKAEFVDYRPGECLVRSDGGKTRKLRKAVEILKGKAPFREKLRFIRYKKNYAKNYYGFLGLTSEYNFAPDTDLLIIGSDEVFNCVQDNVNVGFTPELFGEGIEAKRKISYAASFGNTTLDKLEQYKVADKISSWLGRLDAISVRDRNSSDIVNKLTGIKPVVNLDPVLMYDFEKNGCIPEIHTKEKYIVLYGYSNRFTAEECSRIRSYAKRKGYKIYCIGGVQSCCDAFIDCSPFEVIAYFKNAEAVITDTFHGCILSVITHKRFTVFVRSEGYGNSEKITDLLKRLKLTDRIAGENSIEESVEYTADYSRVDAVIKAERQNTREFLKEQIALV